jgi:hypothetical protein
MALRCAPVQHVGFPSTASGCERCPPVTILREHPAPPLA